MSAFISYSAPANSSRAALTLVTVMRPTKKLLQTLSSLLVTYGLGALLLLGALAISAASLCGAASRAKH